MSSREEKAKSMFESRFMSIILMACLVIMCALFVVIIWTVFDKDSALEVLMYLGIGTGAGIIVTTSVLLILNKRNAKLSRNLLLFIVFGILMISLIVSLILYFTVSSWAFIDASSVGLGLTTGIAISYLVLAMFKSNLVSGKIDETEEEIETFKEDIEEEGEN